jgi:predicted transglutaminase-like cysteine proteinase
MSNKLDWKVTIIASFCTIFAVNSASGAGGVFMSVGQQTTQPIGHYNFCNTHPSQCSIRSNQTAPMTLSDERWFELQQVNDLVNTAIVPATDYQIFGVEELWAYPATRGDCEDFALLKQRLLAERGWPMSSLLITVVTRPDGQGHAVLTVRTDRGDLVLDNLDSDVRLWTDTTYRYVKRQSEQNTGRWVSINDGRTTTVGYVADR